MSRFAKYFSLSLAMSVGFALLLAVPVWAHQFAPALLELQEGREDRVAVRWKQPAVRVMGSRLQPVLPGDCTGIGKPTVVRRGTGMEARWEISCPDGLVGRIVGVEGVAASRADVLLRVGLQDGRSFRDVLTEDDSTFTIPERERRLSLLINYVKLGLGHILTGFDHLLFVLGLTLLVGYGRLLLWTITAFTLGHSITLALAVLGFVDFPPGPIEAGIALSIYVLAVDLTRSNQETVLHRYPWFVAGLFGLLHGLGFAGALAEVGLPEGEIPLALFSFNVGIELGQLAFVALVLALWTLFLRLPFAWPRIVQLLPGYTIGSLAAFWFFERTFSWVLQNEWLAPWI